ncbi:MAG: class I SAM-dependent methyltransferase [Alphaproteobacteria bacterium]
MTENRGQTWDADSYARSARFVSDLGAPLVDVLAPRPGERVLDLGCGDGALTEELVRRGAIVVGVDASAGMVETARRRGLDARLADGQDLPFAAEFDAVFSNAAIHWMPRQAAVAAGVRRALKPGGRFIAEFGGAGNVAAIRAALYAELADRGGDAAACDPWTFPTDRAFAALLADAGFSIDSIALIPRPTPLPGTLADWLEIFAGAFLATVPAAERTLFSRAVAARAASRLQTADGTWSVDYVRLRFAARLN